MLLVGHLLLDPDRPPTRGWIVVADGRIADIGHDEAGNGVPLAPVGIDGPTIGDAEMLIAPGFIDAHMHLPQIDSIGCDELELLDWLERVIFPAEAAWCDPKMVADHVHRAFNRMRAAGTVGAAAFASPIAGAMPTMLETAGAIEPSQRVRLVVGQALMDRGGPATLLGESVWKPGPTTAIAEHLELSINPRFAVSCTDALLAAAAHMARALPGPIIHTHLAESPGECEMVRRLFPDDPSYTAVYDRHGLLGPRTLLAHAIHLGPEEWRTIADRRSVVVHCPQANTFLRSGLFDLRSARDYGVRVALGSDIAAGCDLAMPRVARAMIEVAKLRRLTLDASAPIPTPAEAWRMITEGNADALGWSACGRLAPGATADLLFLRTPWAMDDPHLMGRLIHDWDACELRGLPA